MELVKEKKLISKRNRINKERLWIKTKTIMKKLFSPASEITKNILKFCFEKLKFILLYCSLLAFLAFTHFIPSSPS